MGCTSDLSIPTYTNNVWLGFSLSEMSYPITIDSL